MSEFADMIVRNGRVYTVNEAQPWAEAIAVSGDRIVHVGSDESIEAFIGPDTEVIDLQGKMVLPGIIDAHVHCMMAYEVFSWASLGEADTRDEAIEAMKKQAREHPDHAMVGGSGFRYSALMVDGRLPTRQLLDTVDSRRPVLLMSYDGWTGIVNSRLLEIIMDAMGDEDSRGSKERASASSVISARTVTIDPGLNPPSWIRTFWSSIAGLGTISMLGEERSLIFPYP